jgi:hypothetical protein
VNRLLDREEWDLGSQAGTRVPAEVVGIQGARLVLLASGCYALISDVETPPNPDEVLAILREFIPNDWVVYAETAEEDRDTAYYGPE